MIIALALARMTSMTLADGTSAIATIAAQPPVCGLGAGAAPPPLRLLGFKLFSRLA